MRRSYRRQRGLFVGIRGQSNAVGGGTEARTSIYAVPYQQLVYLDPDQLTSYQAQWGPTATRPVNHQGAEFGFADTSIADGAALTLDKWAVSGSAIEMWLPSAGTLYPQSLAYSITSRNTCPGWRNYDAMFWWQGEADAGSLSDAANYGTHLGTLANAWRTDLQNPNLIVCAVRLRADSPMPYTAEERASLEAWGASNPVLNRWVNVDDLPVKPDGIHYDWESLEIAGTRGYNKIVYNT